MVDTCPCCGRPKIDTAAADILTKMQQKVFNVINSNPECSVWKIIDEVYCGRSINDTKIIHVHIYNANRRLISQGLRIVSSGGRGSTYTVKVLDDHPH